MEHPNTYPALFGDYIIARTKHMLHVIQQEDFVHSVAQHQKLMYTLDYSLQWSDAWPVTSKLLLDAAPQMERAGYRSQWISYLEQGISKSQQFGEGLIEAELLFQIGILHRLQSQFELAYPKLRSCMELYSAFANSTGQAKTLNQLAYIAYLQHDYHNALNLLKKVPDLLGSGHLELATTYFVHGMIEIEYDNWPEAEIWHRRSLDLRKRNDDGRGAAWSLHNIAYALRSQSKFTEAIRYYQLAAETLESLGDIYHWSHAQMNLGLAYLHSGQPEFALEYLLQVENHWKKMNAKLDLAKLYTNLGLCYMDLEKLVQAENAFKNSIELCEILMDHSIRLNAVDGLAMTLIRQGRHNAAIVILEQGLVELSQISGLPNHEYLTKSFNEHLADAWMRD